MNVLRIMGLILAVLFCLLIVGPFLVPVPALEGTVSPEQLADPDSRFVDVGGLRVHYKIAGQGEPIIVLLHGFAASTYSWREVITPLARLGTVIAYDRPAFGLTSRPMPGEWQGESPYGTEAQARLAVDLLDVWRPSAAVGTTSAVLIGNSAGGTVAVLTALRYPERVRALVLVDAAIYTGGGSPGWLGLLQNTPQARRVGPLFVRSIMQWGRDFGRSAWHDPSRFTEEIWAGYTVPLRAVNWDRALWELTIAGRPTNLPQQLPNVRVPTLVVTGDDDRIVPTQQSIRLASELPNARLVVIPACGHVPHEECPQPFLQAVTGFLAGLP